MKKIMTTVVLVGLFAVSLTSCREKTTGEKAENAIENVANDVGDAIDGN